MSSLLEYFEALERLRNDAPLHVPKGTKISNDSVALEAGRQKGSIKKSRPVFASLIQEINNSKSENSSKIAELEMKLNKERMKALSYREKYEALLVENLMLLNRIYTIEK